MTGKTGTLIAAHGRLWYDDPIYRLSWIFGPQCLVLPLMCWMFWPGPSASGVPWGKPVDPAEHQKEMLALRNQAINNRDAMLKLERIGAGGDTLANFYLGTLYDPSLNMSKLVSPDIARSILYYEASAQGGDADAQNNLVNFYSAARFGRLDAAKACQWAAKDIANPSAYVLLVLGDCLANGSGNTKIDIPAAVSKYDAASKKGNLRATAILGYYYESGQGNLPKNPETAVKLYKQAADKGDALGMHNLGASYDRGIGSLPRDSREAARLLALALDQKYAFTVNTLTTRPQVFSAQTWQELQRQLGTRNLYSGPFDGIPNPATLDAIRKLGGAG